MGLAERQQLMALLVTDARLRGRLAGDLPGTAAALGLSTADAAWLAALPADRVEEFANSLIAKRRGEVAKLLPATARALGPSRFADRFRRHAARSIPDGPRKHRDDAVAFAGTLRDGFDDDPPWLADLAHLEASALQAQDPARRGTVCFLAHHPIALARSAEGGAPPGRRPTLVAWYRVPGGVRPRRVVLTRPW